MKQPLQAIPCTDDRLLSLSLSIFQKELKLIRTKISMQEVHSSYSTAAKMWRQPKCPSSDE